MIAFQTRSPFEGLVWPVMGLCVFAAVVFLCSCEGLHGRSPCWLELGPGFFSWFDGPGLYVVIDELVARACLLCSFSVDVICFIFLVSIVLSYGLTSYEVQ